MTDAPLVEGKIGELNVSNYQARTLGACVTGALTRSIYGNPKHL